MPDPALPHLTDWGNFYVIIGSAAAGLTGLMFVVITLGAQAQTIGSEKGIRAFVTPTVVHFCSALMIAVYTSSPGQSPKSLGIGTAVGGIAGLTYVVWAMRAAHRLREYEPVGSDWMWHAAYPILAYLHPHRRRGDVLHGAPARSTRSRPTRCFSSLPPSTMPGMPPRGSPYPPDARAQQRKRKPRLILDP